MPQIPQPAASFFTQVDINPSVPEKQPTMIGGFGDEHVYLLRQILSSQDRQTELLQELVTLLGTHHRQRINELGNWRQNNPELAKSCRRAADALTKVHNEFLGTLTSEIYENSDVLMDGEFMLNEFVDRFGPRLAHLNGVLHVLSQLGSPTAQTEEAVNNE